MKHDVEHEMAAVDEVNAVLVALHSSDQLAFDAKAPVSQRALAVKVCAVILKINALK